MNTTQIQTPQNYHLSPAAYPAAKAQPSNKRQIDAITKHRIYDCLLSFLENKQIRSVKTGKILSLPIQEMTIKKLREQYGFSPGDIKSVEDSIFRDVEKMSDYEIVRDVPPAIYRIYNNQGKANVILENRIVSIPNFGANAFICETLQKEFSRNDILSVDGFVKISDRDEETGVKHRFIRLDLDETYCRTGFIVPIVRAKLIAGLKIYRYPNDLRPFTLKTRAGGLEK